MHKAIIFSLFILYSFGTVAQKQVIYDPNAIVRSNSQSFNGIDVCDGIDVYINQSDSEAIAVSASKKEDALAIITTVENKNLKIYFDSKKGSGLRYENKKLKVYLSFKNINSLNVSAGSDVYVVGNIVSPFLKVNVSGGSIFKGAVQVDTLQVDLSGASDADIKGTATNLTIQASGASDVLAYDLIVSECNIKASGASDINITVNRALSVHATGASKIRYRGTAVIKYKQTRGASSVIKKEE
jgi:hypothetical protein